MARRSSRATSSTRSTASAGGGYDPWRQPLPHGAAGLGRWRRGQGGGVGGVEEAGRSSRGGRRRRPAGPAWRARTGTTSRPAMSEHRGSSSARTRLRTKRGSPLVGSRTGSSPRWAHRPTVSARRRPSSGWVGSGPHPGQAVHAGAPEQVDQHGLGLVVRGVPGGGAGAEGRVAGLAGPRLEVGAVGHVHPHGPERRAEPGGGVGHDLGLARPTRDAARGRRGRRSPHSRPRWPGPAGPASPVRPTRRRPGSCRTRGTCSGPAGRPPPGRRPAPRPRRSSASGQDRRRRGAADPGDPRRGLADLLERGEPLRARARRCRAGPVPPDSSTAAMNRSPSSYWRSLASMPISCCRMRDRPWACLRRARSTWEKWAALGMSAAPARSMVTSPWPSSRLISAWIRWRPSSCSGVATRPMAPLSSSGFRPARISSVIRLSEAASRPGSGCERAEPLLDQRHEVVAHPRDGRELAAVGDLVQGEPQAELPGLEAVLALEGHHVRAHEVDEVLVVGGLLGQEQVVLAEDPGREPAQDHAHLRTGGRPADRRPGGRRVGPARRSTPRGGSGRAGRGGARGAAGSWRRWHCTHPARSVTRARAGPAAERRPVESATSSSALGGQLGELLLEQVGAVRGGHPGPAAHPGGHPLGGVPPHRAGHRRYVVRSGPGGVDEGHGDQCREAGPSGCPGRWRPSVGGGRALFAQRLGHPLAQGVGHVVLAAVRHQLAQLLLESVGADARTAEVEVPGDLDPPLLGQLAVEVVVQPLDRLVAARGSPAGGSGTPAPATGPGTPSPSCPIGSLPTTSPPRQRRRARVPFRHRPTPSAGLFFRDGSGS